MRIKSVELKNFKRFTDLTIADIPEKARLVLLVGPNGCGKSSVLDALHFWYSGATHVHKSSGDPYYYKRSNEGERSGFSVVRIHGGEANQPPYQLGTGTFHFRSAFRNEPTLRLESLSTKQSKWGASKVENLSSNNAVMSENFAEMIVIASRAVFSNTGIAKSVEDVRTRLVAPLRESIGSVLGGLTLNEIGWRNAGPYLSFSKPGERELAFEDLSGGERAVVDLLLDFHLKQLGYNNAALIYDEIETHIHAACQGALLEELARSAREDTQLWVTTHSLGVLRAAQRIEADAPGSVCLIDLDGVNAESTCVIGPSRLDRVAWKKFISVALGDFVSHLAPENVVVCEGNHEGKKKQRRDFDKEVYETILGRDLPHVSFVSGGGCKDMPKSVATTESVLRSFSPAATVCELLDRDDLSDQEVAGRQREKPNLIVLKRRNLECYLWENEVLSSFLAKSGQSDKFEEVLQALDAALLEAERDGIAKGDCAAASGRMFKAIKGVLKDRSIGGTSDTFMKNHLAPHVLPGMACYEELKRTILEGFSRLQKRTEASAINTDVSRG